MRAGLPDHVVVARAASVDRSFSGSLAVAKLPRLLGLLAGDRGAIEARFAFRRDEGERVLCRLRLDGTLELTCQRCLKPFEWPLQRDNDLQIVPDEAAAARVDEAYDPCVAANGQLDLHTVAEDEAILALPLVPKHPDPAECDYRPPAPPPKETKESSPFDVLRRLKDDS